MKTQVYRFWKPFGVLTKFTDPEGRPTLADYIDVPDIYAVGRLDLDSEGLLLLTDDGRLNARLTQPQYAHPRTYWVQIERIPEEDALDQLRRGVLIQGQKTRPAIINRMDAPQLPERPIPVRFRKSVPTSWLAMTLTEGRNRQVRRMTAAVGHPTLRLVRWSIGPVSLQGLEPGAFEILSAAIVNSLWHSVNKNA